MVPMHAEKSRKGALHKPGSDEPTPDPSQEGNWPTGGAPLLGGAEGGFIVPMHAKTGMEVFHEPPTPSLSLTGERVSEGRAFAATERLRPRRW